MTLLAHFAAENECFSLTFPFTYFLVHLSSLYEKSKLRLIACFVRVTANPIKRGRHQKTMIQPLFPALKVSKNLVAGFCSACGTA